MRKQLKYENALKWCTSQILKNRDGFNNLASSSVYVNKEQGSHLNYKVSISKDQNTLMYGMTWWKCSIYKKMEFSKV